MRESQTQPMTTEFVEGRRVSVQAGFFAREGEWMKEIRVADSTSKVLFVVHYQFEEAVLDSSERELVIELWRGNHLRHRLVRFVQPMDGPRVVVHRLRWGQAAGRSSRLRCRIHVDRTPVGAWELLLTDVPVDAQGRFTNETRRTLSHATMVAHQREYEALFDPRKD